MCTQSGTMYRSKHENTRREVSDRDELPIIWGVNGNSVSLVEGIIHKSTSVGGKTVLDQRHLKNGKTK